MIEDITDGEMRRFAGGRGAVSMEIGAVHSTTVEVEGRQGPGVLLLVHLLKQTTYEFKQP